jgi:diguanylate cyclase (GGDEF)-like protein/PAS domain S-box-containing protein
MKRGLSIRSYLLLLVLGIMAPFLALHAYLLYQHAQRDREMAEQLVVGLANVAAGDTEHFLFDAKTALQRVTRQPAIRSLNPKQCDTYLRLFPCVNPNFCSISVVTRAGQVVCSEAEPPARAVDVAAGKNWLQRVIQENRFIVSEPFVDPNNSRQVVVLGYPIHQSPSTIIGAVAIAIDLLDYDSVHYKSALANARLPPGSVVTIVNATGKVIARWPNAPDWVGTQAGDVNVVRRILAAPAETPLQAQGMDGIEKLYGFAHIQNTDWSLYVGIPTTSIVLPAVTLLTREALLGAGIAVLATILAFLFSGLIRGPIRRLYAVVGAATDGHLEVRVPLRGPRELIDVGAHINNMLSARAHIEEALALEKERLEVTLASIGDAVLTTDASGNVTYLNPVAEQLTGWNHAQAQGLPFFEIVNLVDSATRNTIRKTLEQAIADGFLVSLTESTVLIRRDGNEVPVADCAAPIRDRTGKLTGTVLVFRDVSKTHDLSLRLSWQATHDALTGIYNRMEFDLRLGQALASARQQSLLHALLYLDLDQFKIVNDTCGHIAGDDLLQQLTSMLQTKVRDHDTLARLGGDEFGVLLENCPLDQALRIADDFREMIQDFRFSWEGTSFSLGVSIGVVPISSQSGNPQQILSEADAACYVAKEKGRNRVHVFQTGNLEFARRLGEMQWVQRISSAFEEQRFLLYCQSIIPLGEDARAKTYREILIRMRDEGGDILLPGSFLPAAERYNLMPTIDRWVLRTLLAKLSTRSHELADQTVYSVNISGPALSDEHFLEFVIDQLGQSQVPAASICFEITETAAVSNLVQAMRFITVLKNMGCSFALDDFGTGLSSFSYLKSLPINHLKIAGNFVRDILTDPIDHALVEAINHIGHVMQLTTIAEYVESDAILVKLKIIGIDYAQGFAIDQPQPLDEYLGKLNVLETAESGRASSPATRG